MFRVLLPLTPYVMLRRCVLLALAVDTCSGYAFRVCGNYCGPGWCNAIWEEEAKCNDTADTDGSCPDACCKTHDTCCGHTTPGTGKEKCNRAIVACLDACGNAEPWCRDKLGVPFAAKLIADSMGIVEDWCCGAPCPKTSNDSSVVEELARLDLATEAKAAEVEEVD